MDNRLSNIKDRIPHISGYYGIRRETFFEELGFSYANFRGAQKKKPISSESIEKVLEKYPEINPAWLIAAEGNLARKKNEKIDEGENMKILKEQVCKQQYYIEFFVEQKNNLNSHIEKLINKMTE